MPVTPKKSILAVATAGTTPTDPMYVQTVGAGYIPPTHVIPDNAMKFSLQQTIILSARIDDASDQTQVFDAYIALRGDAIGQSNPGFMSLIVVPFPTVALPFQAVMYLQAGPLSS